jgi:hypothetical protein
VKRPTWDFWVLLRSELAVHVTMGTDYDGDRYEYEILDLISSCLTKGKRERGPSRRRRKDSDEMRLTTYCTMLASHLIIYFRGFKFNAFSGTEYSECGGKNDLAWLASCVRVDL